MAVINQVWQGGSLEAEAQGCVWCPRSQGTCNPSLPAELISPRWEIGARFPRTTQPMWLPRPAPAPRLSQSLSRQHLKIRGPAGQLRTTFGRGTYVPHEMSEAEAALFQSIPCLLTSQGT